jgi:hypothetical protein
MCEASSWAATTGGHSGDVVRDVMLAAVENRFGNALKAPAEIRLRRLHAEARPGNGGAQSRHCI